MWLEERNSSNSEVLSWLIAKFSPLDWSKGNILIYFKQDKINGF